MNGSRSFHLGGRTATGGRVAVAAVAVAILAASAAGAAQQLSGKWTAFIQGGDLTATWREPVGDWVCASEVFLAPNDETRLAWKPVEDSAKPVAVVNGKKGRTRHLFTKLEHADVEAHVEFMVSKGSNSGVYFMGRYEIQVFDSWDAEKNRPKENPKYSDCGGIYERWKDNKGYEGRSPRVNAAKKPGEWQTFDVVFRAPRFDASGKKTANARFVKVVHNGKVIHENEEVTGPTRAAAFQDEKPLGPLMLQGDHGPVAYANVRLRALPPESTSALDLAFDRLPQYDFGDSGKDLEAIDEAIRTAPPDERRTIETRLVAVLTSAEATFAAKQYVCRKLRTIGTDQSIPALAKLLPDEKLSHMARYALEPMPSPKVDLAFLEALNELPGKQKVGLIGSIAARRDTRAVAALARLIDDDDKAIARAALLALGKIGGPVATERLRLAKVPDALQADRAHAYLLCGDKLLAEDQRVKALTIYKELVGDRNPPSARIGAIRGIVQAKDKSAIPELKKALKSEHPAVRSAAERAIQILGDL